MKVSVNKAKSTSLCAGNCATILFNRFDYKFAFEPKKFLGLLRNGPQVCFLSDLLKVNP